MNESWTKCFCRKSHSALSVKCDSCEALGFPFVLFLVNCQFGEAASEVFYSSNEFALNMLGAEHPSSVAAGVDQDFLIVPSLYGIPNHALCFFNSEKLDFTTRNSTSPD